MLTILQILWDLLVFVLPLRRLLKLQVRDIRKKVVVVLTFLVGLFGTVCAIVRLQYLTQWGKTVNATRHYNDIALWSIIEGDVGIICACMPAIAGPVLYFLRYVFNSTVSKSRSKSRNGQVQTRASGQVEELPARRGGPAAVDTALKGGGISKTVTSVMYNMPYDAKSDDDVELMPKRDWQEQNGSGHSYNVSASRDYSHEYARRW
jgi:hypothetical protein